jgi:DNA processing protein
MSYPPRNENLFELISRTGYLISEVAPGAVPHRGRFLVRNRVIAAITRGTVVVEAAIRSGSLATANQLLRHGALAVTCAPEIVEALGDLGTDLAQHPRGGLTPLDRLDPTARTVLDALPARGILATAEVARGAGLAPAEVIGALALLEMHGMVRRREAGWSLVRGALRGAPN